MNWPIASDYQDAVQNPRLCFTDPDLKSGKVKEDRFGMPIPSSGQFAVVYKLITPEKCWAVKCFTTKIEDHQKRYAAISAHLQKSRLRYAVSFEYLAQGIRIKGQLYPILKMEWIDGESLNSFVAKNLSQPARLLQLTREWVEMMNGLKTAQIAHGDLQHGNILVTSTGLRLIDYDGMYVPALFGLQSHEEGHRNYQHPKRTGHDFGMHVDNFSAWVVFCSISAVALEPRLWQLADGGDECLLFRRDDFLYPERSRVFQVLNRSRPEVRAIADHFRWLLSSPIRQVPALDGRIALQESIVSQPARAGSKPDWLSDHVHTEPTRTPEPAFTAGKGSAVDSWAGADWIIQHLVDQQGPVITFRKHSFAIERCFLSLLLVILATVSIAAIQGAITAVAGAVGISAASGAVLMLFIVRYGYATHAKERRKPTENLRLARSAMKMLNAQMKHIAIKRREALAPLEKLESEFRKLQQSMNQKIVGVQQRVQSFRVAFDQERQKLASHENKALRVADQDARNQSASLQVELNKLSQVERSELDQAMTNHRTAYIQNRLHTALVQDASLHRVGVKLKTRLEAYGIRTAADVDYYRVMRVEGFGRALAGVVCDWRNDLQARATQTVPLLPDSTTNAIRSKFGVRKRDLESQISSTIQREQRMRNAVLEKYQQARAAYDKQEHQHLTSFDDESRLIRAKYQHELEQIDAVYRKKKASMSSLVIEHDSKFAELSRQRTQRQFEECKLEREIDSYRRLSWARYLALTIGLGRAA